MGRGIHAAIDDRQGASAHTVVFVAIRRSPASGRILVMLGMLALAHGVWGALAKCYWGF